jgi:hypothetical protein
LARLISVEISPVLVHEKCDDREKSFARAHFRKIAEFWHDLDPEVTKRLSAKNVGFCCPLILEAGIPLLANTSHAAIGRIPKWPISARAIWKHRQTAAELTSLFKQRLGRGEGREDSPSTERIDLHDVNVIRYEI